MEITIHKGSVMMIDADKHTIAEQKIIFKNNNCFHDFVTHTDPRSALESLSGVNRGNLSLLPQLIIFKVEMPYIDGFQFMERYIKLDSIRYSNYFPILFVISKRWDFISLDKMKRYQRFGVIDHINKRLDNELLSELLTEHHDEFELQYNQRMRKVS